MCPQVRGIQGISKRLSRVPWRHMPRTCPAFGGRATGRPEGGRGVRSIRPAGAPAEPRSEPRPIISFSRGTKFPRAFSFYTAWYIGRRYIGGPEDPLSGPRRSSMSGAPGIWGYRPPAPPGAAFPLRRIEPLITAPLDIGGAWYMIPATGKSRERGTT